MKRIEDLLKGNTYPGRGIIAGLSADGVNAVSAYFIMGRSENSRNRVFEEKGEDLYTRAFDESKVEDPSLIIYRAVASLEKNGEKLLAVTNGDQTDTIAEGILVGDNFKEALKSRKFEPDAPNYTSRISSLLHIKEHRLNNYEISILKAGDSEGKTCNRYTYDYEPFAGRGHFIHTYEHDGNPLPAFTGEPRSIEIPNDIDAFTDAVWNSLNEDNKISLFVRYINLSNGKTITKVINKNK